MTTEFPRTRQRSPFGARWLALLALSLLLHAAAFEWANGYFGPHSRGAPEPGVVTAHLQRPPIEREALPAPQPAPVAPRKKAPRPRPKPEPEPAPVANLPAESSPPFPAPAAMTPPGSESEVAAETAKPEPLPEPEPDPVVDLGPEPETEVPVYRVVPPPSVLLKYDVEALRDGQRVYGHGSLSWESDGSRYVAAGDAGILFFTVLTFKSEGEIDNFGVAPVVYKEKRFRKSATNTHFHRERNTISFSASGASYSRNGGEQDRATVIWQLAGIGRGDNARFAPGAQIDLFVAGVRDAETWRIKVLGQEEIEVGGGKTSTWHVTREPRTGSYDQKIDVWYAPQQEWYPVRVRYTERNGDYLELSLSNMTLAAAPPASTEKEP